MIEDHARERRLRHERMIFCPAVRKENLHMIRQDPKARVLLRHVVRHDEVEVLFREFLLRIRFDVLCLRRKADENLTALFLPELIEDVGVARERQRQRPVRFLDLVLRRLCRAVVRHSRRLDDGVCILVFREHGRIHVARTPHIHAPNARRRLEMRRP